MSRKYRYSASLFIGETTRGRSMPVFFDTHSSIFNNKPPGSIITGGPGSGKTFLALTLTCMSAIIGKITIVLDPKGDFLKLFTLKEELGEFAIWNLADGKTGLLDPFYMTNDEQEKLSLTISLIDIFVGGLNGDQITALSPILKDVRRSKNPSLQNVVDELRGSENTEARNLGTQLDLFRNMKFAKLCFAPGTIKRASVALNKGMTVISLVDLELPLPGETNPSRPQRLALGILFLITDFIRRIMNNEESENPKTIVIDEAHAVISTDAGARAIKQLALLGRSKNLALILITQNVSHIENLDIENTISTRFAFKSDIKESVRIIEDMELPLNEGFEEIITSLENGECLMKDWTNRYSTVKISSWKTNWTEAFATNPLDVLEKKKNN